MKFRKLNLKVAAHNQFQANSHSYVTFVNCINDTKFTKVIIWIEFESVYSMNKRVKYSLVLLGVCTYKVVNGHSIAQHTGFILLVVKQVHESYDYFNGYC